MDSAKISMRASSSSFFSLSHTPSKPSSKKQLSLRDKSLPFFTFPAIKCKLQKNPDPKNPSSSPFPCQAVASSPPHTSPQLSLKSLISEFNSLSQPVDRVKALLHYATLLHPFPESCRVVSNRVMGCTAQVWLDVKMDEDGRMRFWADSDSEITKGFCACLVLSLDGCLPEDVLNVKSDDLGVINVGLAGGVKSRGNTWHNVLVSMQKRTKALVAAREGKPRFELFPSLVVTTEGISAQGSYAEAQVCGKLVTFV